MAGSDRHNEFVRANLPPVGRALLDQGKFAQQMVALESLVAGLFAVIIANAGKSRADADVFLSALTHGVRGRLDTALISAAASME